MSLLRGLPRLVLAVAVALSVCAVLHERASASTCSQAHQFTTGETLTGTILNANPANFVACLSAIDNNNIGSGGIYASQIKPTSTAQATFGGQFGYVLNPGVASQVPLSIYGFTAQSVDLFDVFSVSATTKYVWIDSGGVLHTNQAPQVAGLTSSAGVAVGGALTGATSGAFSSTVTMPQAVLVSTGAGGLSGSQVFIQNDAAATNGMNFNVPTSATNGYRFNVNGVPLAQITSGGVLAAFGGGAYSAPASGPNQGDAVFQRSSTTGAFWLGGAGGAVAIDYAVTNTGAVTIGAGNTSRLFVSGVTLAGGRPQITLASAGTNGIDSATGAGGFTPFFFNNTGAANGTYQTQFATGGTAIAGVSLGTGTYVAISDRREKHAIKTIGYGVNTVMALRPSQFTWNKAKKHDVGFIAQDVQKVVPEVVQAISKNRLGVNYAGLIPVLTRAIQEQQAEIKTLEREVAALKKGH